MLAKLARVDPALLYPIEHSREDTQVDFLKIQICNYDKSIYKIIADKSPAAQRIQQICGVGPITSLAFVLTIEQPERFEDPRDVGTNYLGSSSGWRGREQFIIH